MYRNILVRFWHFPVVTLGPGRRLGIWFQGCSIHCEVCIASENQPFDDSFMITVDELMSQTADALNDSDGVTISGGEPLDQKDSLQSLLNEINRRGKNDLLIYSGYTKNRVLEIFPELPNLAAALISSTERRLQLVRKDTGSYLLGIPQQYDLTILRG